MLSDIQELFNKMRRTPLPMAGRYTKGCNALVAVVVGDPTSAAQIRRRYADLAGLCADVKSDGE
jgi:hypothetical protein